MNTVAERGVLWLATAAMAMAAACGGGGDDAGKAGAAGTSSTQRANGAEAKSTQLDVDPCTLLTIPEMEAAVGSGIERGGFGQDPPGRCNYSLGGDVGRGAVGITNGDPLLCNALRHALDAGSVGADAVKVDVGDGGIVGRDAGPIQFVIGGGCISISASNHGKSLGREPLVALAKAAAGRVG